MVLLKGSRGWRYLMMRYACRAERGSDPTHQALSLSRATPGNTAPSLPRCLSKEGLSIHRVSRPRKALAQCRPRCQESVMQ
ncbi:hypothetical protein T484DRAFT_1967634 [Baffinella frigidus]|nr:hypothetical protein T484DRAFT_1967634 [Cryptophyta sp. CCMP2293]